MLREFKTKYFILGRSEMKFFNAGVSSKKQNNSPHLKNPENNTLPSPPQKKPLCFKPDFFCHRIQKSSFYSALPASVFCSSQVCSLTGIIWISLEQLGMYKPRQLKKKVSLKYLFIHIFVWSHWGAIGSLFGWFWSLIH